MLLGILQILVALYCFANVITRSGPPKEFFDKIDFKANRFLLSLKDDTVRNVLWSLSRSLKKFLIALVILLFIAVYLFNPSSAFFVNWVTVFIVTTMIATSIPWNLDHSNFAKKYYFQSYLMLIPPTPLIALAISQNSYIDFFRPFRQPPFDLLLNYCGGSEWALAFALAGIFFLVYVIIPYILFWLIFLPLFYTLMLSIKALQKSLDYIHSKINPNILLVIMGIVAVGLSPF